MTKLDVKRTEKLLTSMIDNKNSEEEILVLSKLSDSALLDLINTSNNTKLLAKAEDEFVRRNNNSDSWEMIESDNDVVSSIYKHWRFR